MYVPLLSNYIYGNYVSFAFIPVPHFVVPTFLIFLVALGDSLRDQTKWLLELLKFYCSFQLCIESYNTGQINFK